MLRSATLGIEGHRFRIANGKEITRPISSVDRESGNKMGKGNAGFIGWMLVFVLLAGLVYGASMRRVLGGLQYKEFHRELVTAIANGRAEYALECCGEFMEREGGDAESYFVRAMALSELGRGEAATECAKRAVENMLSFGRFLAGPRGLFENLYGQAEFQDYAERQGVVLVGGPVVGAVTAHEASVWVRTAAEAEVTFEAKKAGDDNSEVVSDLVKTDGGKDYTGVLRLEGLSADTEYVYEVKVDGKFVDLKPRRRFRTFPEKGVKCKFSVGFGGGAGYTPWHERIWNTILWREPAAFLLLGDNVYIDTPEVRQTQRYCYYRRQSRREYRGFASTVPIFSIWDDHDFGTNDCTSSPDLDVPAWKGDVLEVFKENFVNPYYGGGRERPGCWFDFSIGEVDLFCLDCRFYRQNPAEVAEPSMLGGYQKEWLLEKLLSSEAEFKVVASSVPWSAGVKPGSKDTWDGFSAEREEIFSFIEDNGIEGVILLSADRHRSDARKIPREKGYDFYEFESSKLTNVHVHKLIEDAEGSEFIFGYNAKCSFGLLTFDLTQEDATVKYEIVNIDGEVIDSLTLKRSGLGFSEKGRR